jgi:hypothetical protein
MEILVPPIPELVIHEKCTCSKWAIQELRKSTAFSLIMETKYMHYITSGKKAYLPRVTNKQKFNLRALTH